MPYTSTAADRSSSRRGDARGEAAPSIVVGVCPWLRAGGPVVPVHRDAPAARLGGFGAGCLGFLQFHRTSALTASWLACTHGSSTAALLVSALRVSALPGFGLVVIARQGLPGVSSSSLVSALWRRAGRMGRLRVVLRCLTISSEERETWAAGSLRPGFGRALHFGAARELLRRSRFQIHRVSVPAFGSDLGRMCLGLVETSGLRPGRQL